MIKPKEKKFKKVYTAFDLSQVAKIKVAKHGVMVESGTEFIRLSVDLVLKFFEEGRLVHKDGKFEITEE